MSAPLKVGVVGVGHLGKEHARIYRDLPEAELVGISDQDPAKAEKAIRVLIDGAHQDIEHVLSTQK